MTLMFFPPPKLRTPYVDRRVYDLTKPISIPHLRKRNRTLIELTPLENRRQFISLENQVLLWYSHNMNDGRIILASTDGPHLIRYISGPFKRYGLEYRRNLPLEDTYAPILNTVLGEGNLDNILAYLKRLGFARVADPELKPG